MAKQYDVIIIGTGAANIIADAALRQHKHIAIIERGAFGGTCLNRGCIPTKILVTAANRLREIEESARIGVNVSGVTLDWEKVSARLHEKVGESSAVEAYYAQFPEIAIYKGTAAFTGKKTIRVTLNAGGTADLEGEQIFIGTGARTKIPKLPGLEEAGYVTSESFFGPKYPAKPYKSLIIIGGGPIGCEFAHVFDAAGTKVTIVQHNVRLLPKEDEEISAFLLKQFRRYGVNVELNKDTMSVRVENGEKVLAFRDRTTGEEGEVRAEEILVAPGISPTTDLLHLENTDVKTDKRGFIPTNEFLETTAEGIWAIGDINGQAPFRHKANCEAEILADNLFDESDPSTWRWMLSRLSRTRTPKRLTSDSRNVRRVTRGMKLKRRKTITPRRLKAMPSDLSPARMTTVLSNSSLTRRRKTSSAPISSVSKRLSSSSRSSRF